MGDNMPGRGIITDCHNIVSHWNEPITEIEEEDDRSPQRELFLQVIHAAAVVGGVKTTSLCIEEHIYGKGSLEVGQVDLVGDVALIKGKAVIA